MQRVRNGDRVFSAPRLAADSRVDDETTLRAWHELPRARGGRPNPPKAWQGDRTHQKRGMENARTTGFKIAVLTRNATALKIGLSLRSRIFFENQVLFWAGPNVGNRVFSRARVRAFLGRRPACGRPLAPPPRARRCAPQAYTQGERRSQPRLPFGMAVARSDRHLGMAVWPSLAWPSGHRGSC